MIRVAVLVLAALLLGGCSSGPAPRDAHVAPGVTDNGQHRLLDQLAFHTAVREIGVSPNTRPATRLGEAIGARMRAIVTDAGRLDIESFTPPYRAKLARLGPLTEAQFRQKYRAGPLELADRVGAVVGQLDAGLNERADPAPELATAVLRGFGSTGKHGRHDSIGPVRKRLAGLFPESDDLKCLARFRSSYSFTLTVQTSD